MKTQLIKLKDTFILVSDEPIKEGDFGYWDDADVIAEITTLKATSSNTKKIIAGIPELPAIDFSLLSEKDCKTIGWVDVEKLAADMGFYNSTEDNKGNYTTKAFVTGFKTAQSLNDKMFTLEDVKNAIFKSHGVRANIKQIMQSLQQTIWNVEVEMENFIGNNNGKGTKWHPNYDVTSITKITDNSIKVTKIL